MYKKVVFLTITLLFFSTNLLLMAQDLTNSRLPGVQIEGNVSKVLWNHDASEFAVLNGNQILIYDQLTLNLQYSIQSSQGNFISFNYYNSDGYNAQESIIAISEENIITVWEAPYDYPVNTFESEKKDTPYCFTISSDSYYYAAGYADGTCSIFTKDYSTDSYTETNFMVDPLGVEYISFSRNSTYILTIGKGTTINVWNLATGQSSGAIECEEEYKAGAFFSYDNSKVFLAKNPFLAGLYDFSDFSRRDIDFNAKIKKIIGKEEGKTAAILTDDNSINIYDVESGILQGAIPPLSKSPVIYYDMDSTYSRILIAYENGFIQLFQVSKVLMPDLSEAKLTFSEDGTGDFTIGEPGEGKLEIYKMTETKTVLKYKNNNSVIIRARSAILPKPYIASVNLGAGFLNYTLLQPFFLGGFMEGFIGFPSPGFPYHYQIDGQNISGPKYAGAKIYAPLGICLYPFVSDLEFFADLDLGIGLNWMWNARFGSTYVTSNCFPAFIGGLKVGVNYKTLTVFIEGDYDAAVGFTFSIGGGYTINLKKDAFKRKNKQGDSTQQEGGSDENT